MYGVEIMIIIAATLAQSLCGESNTLSVVGVLIFYRVVSTQQHITHTSAYTYSNQIMGIGVGGDYPLSAVITAEFSSTQYRGGIIAAVFAMQGLGQLAAALMTLIVVVAYKDHLQPIASVATCTGQCINTVDKMWRIIIAFGGIPGWFALYYRLTISGKWLKSYYQTLLTGIETPRYTFDVLYDIEKASVDARKYRYGKQKQSNILNPVTQAQTRREMNGYRKLPVTLMEVFRFYSQKRQAIRLFGCAMSWLYVLFNLAFLNASSTDFLQLPRSRLLRPRLLICLPPIDHGLRQA